MKKIIIICMILLCGCTTSAKVNKTKNQNLFDKTNFSNYQNIMIVAHPDDESIWGGIHLLQNNYLVICLTNGNNQTRAKEFYKVMEQTHNTGIILDYPDKTNGKRDNWKKVYHDIEEDLNYILSNHTFTTIVTHNPKGEYGHAHHKMTSAIVTSITKDINLTSNLKYFGHYYRKSNPILPMKHLYNNDLLKQKNQLISNYISQEKTCNKLKHMFPYENWISYQDWY